MIKVVLDTSILISALGWKKGNPRKIFEGCLSSKYQLIESIDLIKEFLEVFQRDKFSFIAKEDKQEFITNLLKICYLIDPKTKINIIKEDTDDNIVLECAFEGKVNYIISGDPHLLKLKEFKGIKIVKPKEFLDIIGY